MSVLSCTPRLPLRNSFIATGIRIANISISKCNFLDQKWRKEKGLPENPNNERIMSELPDYSYIDGRPTPYGSRQKQRIMKQRSYTAKIIELSGEIDFAVTRHKELEKEKEDKMNKILERKLKPKGDKLLDK